MTKVGKLVNVERGPSLFCPLYSLRRLWFLYKKIPDTDVKEPINTDSEDYNGDLESGLNFETGTIFSFWRMTGILKM